MKPDLRTREAKAAQAYMERKGYVDARPHDVIKVEGQSCWYFYYWIDGGILELEVSWQPAQRIDSNMDRVLGPDGGWAYQALLRMESVPVLADR